VRRRLPLPATILAATVWTTAAAGLAAARSYDVTDLGTLGGSTSSAYGLSAGGTVAGFATTAPGVKHATLWDEHGPLDLGAPSGFVVSTAVAVNDAGQVAGNGEGNPQSYRAYRWENDTWTPVGVLPGRSESLAEDIDSTGRIVGRSLTLGAGNSAAFLWDNGTLTDLGSLGGTAEAYGINDAVQVVGRSEALLPDSTLATRAFLWENDVMTNLGVLSGKDYSQAFDVNDAGDAVGSSWSLTIPSFFSADQAVLWRAGGGIVDLGLTPGPSVCVSNFPFYTDNVARAVNNVGQVVGDAQCVASGGALAAFLWQGGSMWNLNDLIDPGAGWNLLSARDIDDDGRIVGLGIAPDSQLHAFLLTPAAPVAAPAAAPVDLRLQVSPSPFRGRTNVSFALETASRVRVDVYDVQGRRVAKLTDGVRGAGTHSLSWNARSGDGQALASGIYFVRVQADGDAATRKVVLRRR
jgi:probable HAF family extracellular repeat protein